MPSVCLVNNIGDSYTQVMSTQGSRPDIVQSTAKKNEDKVLTDTLAGFLAASPEEIQHAAQLMNQKSEADGE